MSEWIGFFLGWGILWLIFHDFEPTETYHYHRRKR